MAHCFNGRKTLCRGVLQEGGNQVNRLVGSFSEDLFVSCQCRCHLCLLGETRELYLIEWMWLDLREFVLHVIGIHRPNLFASWGTQNFDDFDKLVDSGFAREEGLAQHELRHHTTS